MPSSEKVLSPGVFTNEIDQTFLPAAIGDIGAALIGPTVKGPAGIPLVVNSYSEFQQRFGDTVKSGSSYYQYLTSYTAKEYLKHGSALTVVRILAGTYGEATSFVPKGISDGSYYTGSVQGQALGVAQGAMSASLASFKLHTLADGALQNAATVASGGMDSLQHGTNNVLTNSGSKHNLRWEISQQTPKKGTFTLLIRRGDDSIKRKVILESWNNLSLDPNSANYISKVIGNQTWTLQSSGDSPYIQPSGDYPNKSKYIRISGVADAADYLDENGDIRDSNQSASLPGLNSGSFTGGLDGYIGLDSTGGQSGTSTNDMKWNDNITDTNNQGLNNATAASGKTAYEDAIGLLSNQDEYDINLVMIPGVVDNGTGGGQLITKALNMCEDRGDCFVIADPTFKDASISTATSEAEGRDSSYGAMYFPWVQIPDPDLGKNVWVPPSVVMGGVYAFNDKVAHPWFAPAGLNRGGIDMAIQAERKLTHANRDTLYESNMNPIATFPGQGVTVWGQKTLQKKASALDRINVRRLMIKVKKFIASTSRFLVFEQNNVSTRKRFLSMVNPYLEQVQSNSGLNAFRVVMDATNNTPDLVDRNILYGQIFLQPTRTAEFIVLDFTVQPTGATFPE